MKITHFGGEETGIRPTKKERGEGREQLTSRQVRPITLGRGDSFLTPCRFTSLSLFLPLSSHSRELFCFFLFPRKDDISGLEFEHITVRNGLDSRFLPPKRRPGEIREPPPPRASSKPGNATLWNARKERGDGGREREQKVIECNSR